MVGFSVDYSAHIAHAFVHAEGTGEERATEALSTIGRSVLCGGFSTWLAVALLPLSGSYFFEVVLFRSISFAVSEPSIYLLGSSVAADLKRKTPSRRQLEEER